jgi:hypothetical protein
MAFASRSPGRLRTALTAGGRAFVKLGEAIVGYDLSLGSDYVLELCRAPGIIGVACLLLSGTRRLIVRDNSNGRFY